MKRDYGMINTIILLVMVFAITLLSLALIDSRGKIHDLENKIRELEIPTNAVPITETPTTATIDIIEELPAPVCYEVLTSPTPEEEEEENRLFSEEDIVAIAKTLWGECRGNPSDMEKAAVAWVILNRYDIKYHGNETILAIVSEPTHFAGYNVSNPVTDKLYSLALDVLQRWEQEQLGKINVGRVIPSEYRYFRSGKNGTTQNLFFNIWPDPGEYWDWSLPNPYKS